MNHPDPTHNPPGTAPAAPAPDEPAPEKLQIEFERRGLLALLPRGTLVKVTMLLALLAGIVALRMRADLVVGFFSGVLGPTHSAAPPQPDKPAPRVRMAVPPPESAR